jgi:hypothetical protein
MTEILCRAGFLAVSEHFEIPGTREVGNPGNVFSGLLRP